MWNIKFTDYAQKWLENKKGTVEQCIYPYITITNFAMEYVIIRVDFRCIHLKIKDSFLNVY